MSTLLRIITADDPAVRNRSLDQWAIGATVDELLAEADALDAFRRRSSNLYERVRAQLFLFALHRFYLQTRLGEHTAVAIPFAAQSAYLKRRFEECIELLLEAQARVGPGAGLSSALAAAYHELAFQTLASQVRRSVRAVRGNQWMGRTGHPANYPLLLRPELRTPSPAGLYPLLIERTPVRLDLTHSAWSDIFFLGMDFPEGAQVLNLSVDLAVSGVGDEGTPRPPVETYLRVIDEPVLRLTSIDLGATAEIASFEELFDYARDYLGLLKAGVIASGLVPPSIEGAAQPLSELLEHLTGKTGFGIEVVTRVRDIPKGSRLAVSTNLLASLITLCMRATGQIGSLAGSLTESERRLVAARAILGEWLGGSGGGWQDSGGVWPGMKLIRGALAVPGDAEHQVSRGRLLPDHQVLSHDEVSREVRERLQASLVVVHGGMAQDVGPILEMVTERYLLRSEPEWQARLAALHYLQAILDCLRHGDIARLGSITEQNFFGPIQRIIPWATNAYTETVIGRVRQKVGADFWGFWMMGGMAGGGMGFIFRPEVRPEAEQTLLEIMSAAKREYQQALAFAMEPVRYSFALNERGTWAELQRDDAALLPSAYYALIMPSLLRQDSRLLPAARRAEIERLGTASRNQPEMSRLLPDLFERLLPRDGVASQAGERTLDQLLEQFGFDRTQHEQIRADLKSGRIGIAQNRLPSTARVEDVRPGDVFAAGTLERNRYAELGRQALARGEVAVVTLAGGVGSRWTRGAGVVKAIAPVCKFGDSFRRFLDIHFAKTARSQTDHGAPLPHIVTTSYLTHEAIAEAVAANRLRTREVPVYLSPGRNVGLRLVPTLRDLHFAWNEMTELQLDEQKQKLRESVRAALTAWAAKAGEASDYRDNTAQQCMHPVGHWYEIPNLFGSRAVHELLSHYASVRYLLVHNIDTLGVHLDPVLLGAHIAHEATLTAEVIGRFFSDRGGGLARVDGRLRLIESLALPDEEAESRLSYYNTNTFWVDLDRLLSVFALSRPDLGNASLVADAVRRLAARIPVYVTLKEVKRRWGRGQEDVFPVLQWERLWGDMTALEEVSCRFVHVSRLRGQQLKEPAQLDGWYRDGSKDYVAGLCRWD